MYPQSPLPTITAPLTSSVDRLAHAGMDIVPLVALGIILLAVGPTALFVVRGTAH